MLFFLSSKNGGLEGFAPILSTGELPCDGQLQRRNSHRVGFQFSLQLWVLWNEGFYGGRNANAAINLRKKQVTQMQDDVCTSNNITVLQCCVARGTT